MANNASLSNLHTFPHQHEAQWVRYSTKFDPSSLTRSYWIGLYILIALSVIVLLHSYFLNRNKYNTVRLYAEVSSGTAIFGAILVIIAANKPSTMKSAVCYDFFWNGTVNLTIQLCDNYLFLDRFKAVRKVPRWKVICIHMWIWVVITVPWFPTYVIIPFFYDTNSDTFIFVNGYVLPICCWATIAYNSYFTGEFANVLYKAGRVSKGVSNTSQSKKVKIIAMKSILHCMTSSAANIFYAYVPVLGVLIYCIMLIFACHFLFNFKIENYVVSKKERRHMESGRNTCTQMIQVRPGTNKIAATSVALA